MDFLLKKLRKFNPFTCDLGEEEEDNKGEYCGICHSDHSMSNNDWEMTQY